MEIQKYNNDSFTEFSTNSSAKKKKKVANSLNLGIKKSEDPFSEP